VRTEVYIIVRVINNNLDFILFLFYFILLSVEVSFLFLFDLRQKCDMMSHILTVTVTQSCDIEKIIEGLRTDNII